MITLKQFRENARNENLCEEYTQIWDSCKSKKQTMDMCLGVKGMDYVCDAYAKGWGMDKEAFTTEFKNFINGKFVYDAEGYSSEMYCGFNGNVEIKTNCLMILDSDVVFTVQNGFSYQIFASGRCNLTFKGNAKIYLFTYGEKGNIKISGDSDIRHKHKTKRDEY